VRVLKIILVAIATLVALVLLLGVFLPTQAHVERSLVIDAAPEHIYPDVGSLARWPEWTMWNPTRDKGYDPKPEGPPDGVGSTLRWTKAEGGPGFQQITAADPQKGVSYEISIQDGKFVIPGKIAFEPLGTSTRVVWSDDLDFTGNFAGRYIGVMLDSQLGPMIEQSLAQLKTRAEARKAGAKP
jgi:hypothetical protein